MNQPWLCAVRAQGVLAGRPQVSFGTGAFVRDGRHVVTARHVVQPGASEGGTLEVYVPTAPGWRAAEIAFDLLHDLDAALDVVLLRLAGEGMAGQAVLPIGLPSDKADEPASCGGFPRSQYRADAEPPVLFAIPGARLAGFQPRLAGDQAPLRRLLLERGVWPAGAEEDDITRALAGISGAPVLAGPLQRAVGLVVSHDQSLAAAQGLTLCVLGFDEIRRRSPGVFEALGEPVTEADALRLRARIAEVTQQRIHAELGDPGSRPSWKGGTRERDRRLLSQEQASGRLAALLDRGADGRVICLSGPRAIGKTTLALQLARRAAARWLREDGASPLPLLIRVPRIAFGGQEIAALRGLGQAAPGQRGRLVWDTVMSAWLRFANRLNQATGGTEERRELTRETLRAALADVPVLIILDGADDLCQRLGLPLAALQDLVDWIKGFARQRDRTPPRMLMTLREDPNLPPIRLGDELEAGRLRLGLMGNGAIRRFVGHRCHQWIRRQPAALAEPLMRTPLLLGLLRDLPDGQFETASVGSVMADALLRRLQPLAGRLGGPAEALREDCFAIAHVVHRRLHGEPGVGRNFTAGDIAAVLSGDRPATPPGQEDPAAIRLLDDPARIDAIVDDAHQPLFLRMPDGRCRFVHDAWHDLAAGGFFALAILQGRLWPLGGGALGGEMYDFAAELLQREMQDPARLRRLDETLARSLKAAVDLPAGLREANTDEEFAIGNMLVILGRRPIRLGQEAAATIASLHPRLPPLVRHISLSVLGSRVLRRFPEDSPALMQDLLGRLTGSVLAAPDMPWATRSLAWLLAAAITSRRPAHPYPAFDEDRDLGPLAALGFAAGTGGPKQAERRSTLQFGYLRSMQGVPCNLNSIIGSLHLFLFAVAIHRCRPDAAAGLGERLRGFFDPGPPPRLKPAYRSAVRKAAHPERGFGLHGVQPEIEDLLRLAERIYGRP